MPYTSSVCFKEFNTKIPLPQQGSNIDFGLSPLSSIYKSITLLTTLFAKKFEYKIHPWHVLHEMGKHFRKNESSLSSQSFDSTLDI